MDLLTQNQTFASPSEALEHYGKKGMRWGVRNTDDHASETGSSVSTTPGGTPLGSPDDISAANSHLRAKQVAIGLGVLTAAVGAGYVVHQMNKNGGMTFSPDTNTVDKGKAAAEKILQEPTAPVHGTRGKNLGFRFLENGGVDDPFVEWERAGFGPTNAKPFGRYGDNNEKISLTLMDPDGRTDRAGRLIPHDIIVPAFLSKDINNEADVVAKIWPLLKPTYDAFYEKSLESEY